MFPKAPKNKGDAPVTPSLKKGIFMEKRSEEIKFRVTKKEKEKIKRNAKKCGLSMSKYLVNLSLGYKPNEIPSDNFYSVCENLKYAITLYEVNENYSFANGTQTILKDLYEIYIKPMMKEGDKNSNN